MALDPNVALLQHTLSRFGVVTVMDVVMHDPTTKEPLLELDTLKVSSISTDGSSKEIRGGMSADLLLTYNYGRTVNLEMTDALLSLYSLRQMWGGTLNSSAVKYHANEKCTLGSTKTIIFSGTPTTGDAEIDNDQIYKDTTADAGAYLNIYVVGKGKLAAEDYTVTAQTATGKTGYIASIQITNANVAVGDEVKIYALALAKAENNFNPLEMVMKSNSFPTRVDLVGKTVFLDEKTGKQILAEIEIPKFQLGNTFDFAMDAEGDAATFNFSGVALVDANSKEIIKIKTIKQGVDILG